MLNVTDGAGNTASANGATLALDTSAPAVTVHLANDTGSSSTDKITSDPTLTGTGDANAVVHFTVDGNAIATTAIADALGAWTFTPTGLANGTHTVVASETDAAGNSASTSLTFALENPPIETSGVTQLDQVANEFFLHDGARQRAVAEVRRRRRRRRPVRRLDADRGGEDGGRLPGGLEERRRRPVHHLERRQQRQLDRPDGRGVRLRACVPVAGDDVPAGPQCRRHDRPEDDADRDVGRDASGPGGQRVLPARRRGQRAVPEVRRRRRCRRPVRRLDADRGGEDGSGYQVAWKNGSADQYIIWNVDSNGNWTGQTGVVSGSEYALQSLETTFQQDLNADGTTGLKTTPIETSGATHLDQVANEFFLHDGAGNGPSLKYAGADVVAGQFGAWTPIGAEKVGSGYQVAWKNGSADQYILWNVDSNGNWTSQTGVVSGSEYALQSLETTFQQDLNADGTTGLKTTPIETSGATHLDQVANEFFLHDGAGNGPSAEVRRCRRCRRPVRGLDADRGGEGWQRLPGGLEERQRRPVHPLERRQQRQLDRPARAWCQVPRMRCSRWRRRSSRISTPTARPA